MSLKSQAKEALEKSKLSKDKKTPKKLSKTSIAIKAMLQTPYK